MRRISFSNGGVGRVGRTITVLGCLLVGAAASAWADDSPEAILTQVQGDWVRTVRTPNGPVTIQKRHAGNRTVITATDPAGNVLYESESEFSVKQEGPVRVFTFFNKHITAGPDKGRVEKEPRSYIYRIENGRFIEARGLLEGDPERPGMIVWERPK